MAGGEQDDSGMFAAMGIPESMWAQMREKAVVGIYPENWAAVEAYGQLQTQWRSGMGGREGLIYSEVYLWMNEQQITDPEDRQDLMWAIRVMEYESLDIWAKQRSKD